jgi:hypothetical protein
MYSENFIKFINFLFKLNFLVFLDIFNMLKLKIKNIILIYLQIKNTFKNYYYNTNQTLTLRL